MSSKFSDYKISSATLSALEAMGFSEPTGIQAEALPILLEHDGDFVGQAQTGTGKTAAFGIPLVEKINPDDASTQAIVLAPTRELALQISESVSRMAAGRRIRPACVYGGQDIVKQMRDLRADARLVIGTPGRVRDHLRRHTLSLEKVRFVVLDEADEMVSMGFLEEIEEILQSAGPGRRIWMFSATIPPEVARLTETFLKEPKRVKVTAKAAAPDQVVELYCPVPRRDRFKALGRLIDAEPGMYGIVFCRTKADTEELGGKLADAGYPAAALHGDMSQGERERVMKQFRRKKIRLLAATDVAARGLDVDELTHVINYSLPREAESYIHRIGRTGRAGKSGVAITFIDPGEERRIKRLETVTRKKLARGRIPGTDEVLAAHVQRLGGEFSEALKTADDFERHVALLMPLAEKHTPAELVRGFAALLCREIFERYEDDKEITGAEAFDTDGTAEPVEVFVNVGAADGATPGSLVAATCTAAGIDAKRIGRISIKEMCSFLMVDGSVADEVIASLNGVNFGGRRVRANRSDEGRSPNFAGPPPEGGPRRPAGPRRPPPRRDGPPGGPGGPRRFGPPGGPRSGPPHGDGPPRFGPPRFGPPKPFKKRRPPQGE
jgi:ATP-dependent RNA helicase DeaD